MAVVRDNERQRIRTAHVNFNFITLETNLVTQTALVLGAFSIPVGSYVIGGEVVVTTAFVGPTVAVIDVGDVAVPTRYASDVNLLAAARTALTLTGFTYTGNDTINFRVDTTVAVATAGAGFVRLEYVVQSRRTVNLLSLGG